MRPFAAFERFFERIFERPAARLFRVSIQPVQLQHRVERAMENERLTGAERTLVPNRYAVHLHPDDLAGFADVGPTLAAELADGALTYARAHRYTLADRPQVALVPDGSVAAGEIQVATRFVDPGARFRSGQGSGGGSGPAAAGDAAWGEVIAEEDGAPAGHGAAEPVGGGWRRLPDEGEVASQTRIFETPQVRGPQARLRLLAPDGTQRDVLVDGSLLTMGRARDNSLVVHDARVSRYHARLQARAGSLVLTDLGSTNGTRVNGLLVEEVVLGPGDHIQLGDTTLVVEAGPGQ